MKRLTVILLALVLSACGADPDVSDSTGTTGDGTGGKADEFVTRGGETVSYEEFRSALYCEPNDGPCIVQGDIPLWGERAIEDYYISRIELTNALTVMNIETVDAIWSRVDRFDLTFCVSDDFGDDKQAVLDATLGAMEEWEAIAHLDFKYLAEHDGRCNARNAQVKFNVRPVDDEWATYLARAFFPHQPRAEREVLVNMPSHREFLQSDYIEGDYTLQGVMRHELGHVLGFRHEHTRDDANVYFCFEDSDYRVITEYDPTSVMHYPQCNGENDWGLPLTDVDARGAAFFYPDFDGYTAARCDVELDENGRVNEECEPIVHQILELANTASFEELDNWVRLDVRAVEEMVDLRSSQPFNTMADLRAIRYFEDVGIAKMYDYLYKTGRCEVEFDDNGLVSPHCRPVVNRILELANTASQDVLDYDVRLDSRAAANIAVIRKERLFSSFEELWSVDYVKARAIGKMYDYLYAE